MQKHTTVYVVVFLGSIMEDAAVTTSQDNTFSMI